MNVNDRLDRFELPGPNLEQIYQVVNLEIEKRGRVEHNLEKLRPRLLAGTTVFQQIRDQVLRYGDDGVQWSAHIVRDGRG